VPFSKNKGVATKEDKVIVAQLYIAGTSACSDHFRTHVPRTTATTLFLVQRCCSV
jgi:hypothetical protein